MWVVNRFRNEDAYGPLRTPNHRVPPQLGSDFGFLPGDPWHSFFAFQVCFQTQGLEPCGQPHVWGEGASHGLWSQTREAALRLRPLCLPPLPQSPLDTPVALLLATEVFCFVSVFFRTKLFRISSFIHSQP